MAVTDEPFLVLNTDTWELGLQSHLKYANVI